MGRGPVKRIDSRFLRSWSVSRAVVCLPGRREMSDSTTTNLHWNIDKITNELWRWQSYRREGNSLKYLTSSLSLFLSLAVCLSSQARAIAFLGSWTKSSAFLFKSFMYGRMKRERDVCHSKAEKKRTRKCGEYIYGETIADVDIKKFDFFLCQEREKRKRFICRLLFHPQMMWCIIHHNIWINTPTKGLEKVKRDARTYRER